MWWDKWTSHLGSLKIKEIFWCKNKRILIFFWCMSHVLEEHIKMCLFFSFGFVHCRCCRHRRQHHHRCHSRWCVILPLMFVVDQQKSFLHWHEPPPPVRPNTKSSSVFSSIFTETTRSVASIFRRLEIETLRVFR